MSELSIQIMITYNYLPWDSGFFQRRTYSADITSVDDISCVIDSLESTEMGWDTVYVSSSGPLALFPSTAYSVFDVGGHVTLAKSVLPGMRTSREPQNITRLQPNQVTEGLESLSYLAGSLSRFRIDPQYSLADFHRLYKRFLSSTHIGNQELRLYASFQNHLPIALMQLMSKDLLLTINLLSVAPLNQGLGIGSNMLNFALSLASQQGCATLSVRTQASNQQALRFYEKNGFSVFNTRSLYHIHRKRT